MDTIKKLQPHRTMHLQGFDAFGASAALWGASDSGFTVSGVFRDQADFAVLVLFERDDPFGHPRVRYLPEGGLFDIVLEFDITFTGIQAFESKKSAFTDWPYITCRLPDGTLRQRALRDLATGPGGREGASGVFELNAGPITPFDRVTLWYQNLAFDYIVPANRVSCVQEIFWHDNPASFHFVTVAGVSYVAFEGAFLSSAETADHIASQINASDPNVTATVDANAITITLKPSVDGPVNISSSDGSGGDVLERVTVASICRHIANQINGMDWDEHGPVALSASASGNQITITAEPGSDGNMVTLYGLRKNENLYFSPSSVQLSGGSSDNVTWHVSIDFDGLSEMGFADKAWLTFAPALAKGSPYEATEWKVEVTNWAVTSDPGNNRPLKVAGPGSVRIEEDSPWVSRSGFWEPAPTDGFAYWSDGRAIRAAAAGASLTIQTHCQYTHQLYIGTRLDFDCGIVEVSIDGAAAVTLDCYGSGSVVRRRPFIAPIEAGSHTVVITLTGDKNELSEGWYFYFDFLECAVPTDVPDAPEVRADVGVATDYDTDITYKSSPQRLIWQIQKLGLVGEIDHYAGVFWWKQATRSGGSFPSLTVTFGGTWAADDAIFLHIGDSAIGKSVFPADTSATIAAHFAYFINAIFVGVWASVSGETLTITTRSTFPSWLFPFSAETSSEAGTITTSGDLETGAAAGDWVIDPAAWPVFNRAFRDWHADYFAALGAAGMSVTCSFSQELVNPPDNPGGGEVWIQRWWDNSPVSTATGFGTLHSSHCCLGGPVLDYMKRAYAKMADLLSAAGFTPRLQFGEVLWWYQANASGMAFYDADTKAAFQAANGRALARFTTTNDDPSVNSYIDADFLRERLKAYVEAIRTHVLSSHPTAQFELLWPMDVNDPDVRQLNRYVNLPTEWQTRAGSGLDTLVVEGFQYPGVDHNVDQARRCAAYPFAELTWPKNYCRYLMGLYYSGWPWQREYLAARRTGVPVIKIWAYDHLCLFGWHLPLPSEAKRAGVI